MEIKKRLITEGIEVNAVLLNDEGEEYPVFLETLHNTIVFPTLLESGYKIVSLPYGFVKDGVAFDSLPVEEYTPTDEETEVMYASIGVKLAYADIKSHIDTQAVVGIKLPDKNVTINTREELIKYLELLRVAQLEEDFLPLNYFVADDALFTWEEYSDSANKGYIDLINSRRRMSLQKYHTLITWMQNQGYLGANYDVLDVLDAYFQWGIDGLKFTIMSKRREQRPFRLTTSRTVEIPVFRRTQGFIDSAGNMLTPKNEREVVWKLTASNQQEYIADMTKNLAPGETVVTTYQTSDTQAVTILEGINFNITYSDDMVMMHWQSYPTIEVINPVNVGRILPPNLALPNAIDKLYEYCALRALAMDLHKRRKPTTKVSSYKALEVAGLTTSSILRYIITKLGLAKDIKTESDRAMPQITPTDVMVLLSEAGDVKEEVKDFVLDTYEGLFNIDNVGSGISFESSMSDDKLFNALWAVHNVIGISIEDMHMQISQLEPDAKFIEFTDGNISHKIDCAKSKLSVNGYLTDVQSYDFAAAEDCSFFTYVTMIAREVGTPEARRHVGIEFLMVDRNKSNVKALLDDLMSLYEDKVQMTIKDAVEQAKAMRFKHVFALSRFFEIGLKGTYTWTKQLGGEAVHANQLQLRQVQGSMVTKIESLDAYCSCASITSSLASLGFNAYCVNAYVTQRYVIPRGNTPIREVPFYAAWMNLANDNPAAYAQLVNMGCLPQGFVCWNQRILSQQFKDRGIVGLMDNDSLGYYYRSAVNEVNTYPHNKEFVSVTHPSEYLYPGLQKNLYGDINEENDLLDVPREGQPVIRLGTFRNITIDDYRDVLYPTEIIKESDQYIHGFRGYSADGFVMLGNRIFNCTPPLDGKAGLMVHRRSETVYLTDKKESIDFRRIPELDTNTYPIIHAYDRIYLIRDTAGKVWEARI